MLGNSGLLSVEFVDDSLCVNFTGTQELGWEVWPVGCIGKALALDGDEVVVVVFHAIFALRGAV